MSGHTGIPVVAASLLQMPCFAAMLFLLALNFPLGLG